MAQSPSITVVIPTHDRYPKLRSLLRSLERNWSGALDSVIVVDDSANQIVLEDDFRDISLKQISIPQRVFISRAKNIGWKTATTEFVYFIDDDNVVDATTIHPVHRTMVESEGIAAVMPAVLYKNRPDVVWVYATPFLDSRLRLNLVGRNLPRNASLENRVLRTDALPNASMVRRAALREVGGFDERLMVNSSMDFALRLKARNWGVVANSGAFIYHDVEPPGKFGWWAAHGSVDPERVRYEIRDWFLIMDSLHGGEAFFRMRAIFDSSRFVVPNLLAYMVKGATRRWLIRSVAKGYLEGLLLAGHSTGLNPKLVSVA